jgi:hypothetical protein
MSWSKTSIEKYHDVSHDTYDSPKVNLVHQMKVAVLSMFCQGILKNSRSNRSFCYLTNPEDSLRGGYLAAH